MRPTVVEESRAILQITESAAHLEMNVMWCGAVTRVEWLSGNGSDAEKGCCSSMCGEEMMLGVVRSAEVNVRFREAWNAFLPTALSPMKREGATSGNKISASRRLN